MLLISYLPSMYRRSSAGRRPWPRWDRLEDLWREWEDYVDVAETHTSPPALVFFRSPHWELSWATASGAVLHGASLLASTVDRPRSTDAELCIRAGYVALRRIADFFNLRHNPDPHRPEDPISIDRNGSRIRRYNRSRA